MNEQMAQLMHEEAKKAGLSVTPERARTLLGIAEATINDDDRRTALRRLSEVVDEAVQVGGNNAAS